MRVKCEQCEKEFSKPNKQSAENALRMHVARKHGKMQSQIRSSPGDPRVDHKREYQRQYRLQRKKLKGRRNGTLRVMGFCPCCGLNLEVLATALAVVNKV